MRNWKTLDQRLRYYVELVGWPLLLIGGWYLYQHTADVRAALNNSQFIAKAIVTESFYVQSTWTTDVEYCYLNKTFKARGYGRHKYATGDSIQIKFSPQYADEVLILDSSTPTQ